MKKLAIGDKYISKGNPLSIPKVCLKNNSLRRKILAVTFVYKSDECIHNGCLIRFNPWQNWVKWKLADVFFNSALKKSPNIQYLFGSYLWSLPIHKKCISFYLFCLSLKKILHLRQVKLSIRLFLFFCVWFYFTYSISLMYWEMKHKKYPLVSIKRKSKVHEKNASRQYALNFDQWQTFSKNCKPIRVWL